MRCARIECVLDVVVSLWWEHSWVVKASVLTRRAGHWADARRAGRLISSFTAEWVCERVKAGARGRVWGSAALVCSNALQVSTSSSYISSIAVKDFNRRPWTPPSWGSFSVRILSNSMYCESWSSAVTFESIIL